MTDLEFDEMLDGELARAVEARSGLEGRVLARVRAEGRERSGWGIAGWMGGVAACGLAAALLVMPWRHGAVRGAGREIVTMGAGRAELRAPGTERFREVARGRRRFRVVRAGGLTGRRGEEASEALMQRYVAEARAPVAKPEELVVRPLEFAGVVVRPLEGRGFVTDEQRERTDR